MIVRTKKYRLTPSTYIRIALTNVFRQQWWVGLLFIAVATGLFFAQYKISAIVTAVLSLLYIVFWWVQFYSVTKMEENKLMFTRLFYEISRDRITIFLNTKQGMPVDWKQIVSVRQGKDYFLFSLSAAHFIYLPYSAFQGQQQINLVHMLLKNKKLI